MTSVDKLWDHVGVQGVHTFFYKYGMANSLTRGKSLYTTYTPYTPLVSPFLDGALGGITYFFIYYIHFL